MDRTSISCPPSGSGLARLLVFALAGEAVGMVLAVLLAREGFSFATALACVPACGGLGLLLAALSNALPRRRAAPAASSPSSTHNRNGM